ncbi:MAG: hypothetical protein COZ37_01590 [bacterium (Candidatus Ratteibacteria) CG_4_10_14_3_um_filter_41_18]|uniref:YjgP/YjgQ family permease n=4 Tax=Candidatus Ratteibacteria TaxID=2979319 RepID=A0A2M7YED8_9BACT|nr:MAG: hypothetical protein COS11_00165 [bacterium (Candidatus Ratteibacteria) CG01_land_8_20_14_3_00_40_19]PIW34250.1 MAG: hypothetical protein COW28_00245 [bacterium (Candidatus Ratteibacteria) CG15_BIG_FIL_POST_REV_8_21_14_020_41_12]PIW74071.1 MAG: hypothetical protein CO004_02640 [bacterium (Candidatus Ratteibacteria) CG_4_8_14_3_um_filter_41_36]PIX77651.1 MAG: hypothetical protein COZ37_01590 [bacterium (Candidatus Ratteibacteria) CG_4_10_14_3_um_filter_41_18]PJA61351.1 MAG: hypothetical 
MKILKLYFLREETAPFFIGVVFFIFMFSLGNILKLAELFVKRTASFSFLLKFFWNLSVGSLNFSVPLAIFAATLMAFARFSADDEILAVSSSGINPYSLLSPFLVIGLLLSFFTFHLNSVTSPRLEFNSRKIIAELEIKRPADLIQEGTFIRDFKNMILFVGKVKDEKLFDVTIYKSNDQEISTIKAEQGTFSLVQQGIALFLQDGFTQNYNLIHPEEFTGLKFKVYNLLLKKTSPSSGKKSLSKKIREYTLEELLREKKNWQKKGIKNREILTEIQKRISFSFAPFIFILLGIPLGIMVKHSGKFLDFGIVSLVIFLYYLLLTVGEILSKKFLAPSLLWLPNIILGAVGLFLLTKKVKR